jgi:type I restriction enzyme R subunit
LAKGYGLGVQVAFSGEVFDPDSGEAWRGAGMNGFGEQALPKQFASDDYQVLIVAEKYQTGFDQPLLHTMYVDKHLDGIEAVQTLSRLNRIDPGKDDTFVLDFTNDYDDVVAAFAPYYRQTAAAPTDPNLLYTLQRRIEDAGVLDDAEVAAGWRRS